MKRKFIVWGKRPAVSKLHNDFLKACDLGIDGLFVPFANEVTITVSPDCTHEQLEKHPVAIVEGYEEVGCVDVGIREVHHGNG